MSSRNRLKKSESRTTKSRLEKKNRVYEYLVELAKENRELPNLTSLSKSKFNEMHISNLMEILVQLDTEKKIIYKKGKILAINIPKANAYREREYKFNNTIKKNIKASNEIKESVEDNFKCRYEKAVKEVILDYLKNTDITSKDDMIKYIEGITKFTDKLKEKLF